MEISKARLLEKHEVISKKREFALKTKAASSSGEPSSQLFPVAGAEDEEMPEIKSEVSFKHIS